jgi:hypothetical protein
MRRDGPSGTLVFSTSPSNPRWQWRETIRWHRFVSAMGDARSLHVALTRPGRIVTDAHVPRDILTAPSHASAAMRPELHRRLANPAHHCIPETDPPS